MDKNESNQKPNFEPGLIEYTLGIFLIFMVVFLIIVVIGPALANIIQSVAAAYGIAL